MIFSKQIPWKELSPYLKVTFAVVVWGASFIATKLALRDVQPITVVWLRFAMGVVVLGAIVLIRNQFYMPTRTELAYFGFLGFLGITFHQWLQSTGLLTSKASTTAWIVATTPIFIALLGRVVLKEKLKWVQIMGIGLATIGVLLVVSEGGLNSSAIRDFGSPGDILILISAANWALFSVVSRRGLQTHPAALMMFYVMALGWIVISIMFFYSPGVSDLKSLTINSWLSVLFLGIFCSGFAYIFWYDALKSIPASQVGVFLYLEPLVAVIVAALMLGEAIIIASLIGGASILMGVWLVNRAVGNS